MDFLKTLLVSVQGYLEINAFLHKLPQVADQGGRSQNPSCCHLAGSPWWLLAYVGYGSHLSLRGRRSQDQGQRGLCVPRGMCEGADRVGDQDPSSLAWRSEVAVLVWDWAALTSVLFCQGFLMLGEGLRGP